MNPQLDMAEVFFHESYGPRDGFIPRDWQDENLEEFKRRLLLPRPPAGPMIHTIDAGTGSGKTLSNGLICAHMLNTGNVDQLAVVVPTSNILRKTVDILRKKLNIHLQPFMPRYHRHGIPREFQGVILTYPLLANHVDLLRRICAHSPTLVVFDEVHHLGDKNGAWGPASLDAFGRAPFVICLTGTPYRSDQTRIPWVTYEPGDRDGLLIFRSDFRYSLGRAILEGVCRKPEFCFHNATVKVRPSAFAGELVVTFADKDVSDMVARRRLGAAVHHTSVARRTMLAEALKVCREEGRKVIIFLGGDSNKDEDRKEEDRYETPTMDAIEFLPAQLAELGITPEEFVVVTGGKGKENQAKIDEFPKSPSQWIMISINMVSEGTDLVDEANDPPLPSVSAAIFLTSVTTMMTTIQRIGRVLRSRGEWEKFKTALIFMFAHPGYVDLDANIDAEIQVEEKLASERKKLARDDEAESPRRNRAEAVCIGGGEMEFVRFANGHYPAPLVEQTKRMLKDRRLPHTMADAVIQLMMEQSNGAA